MSFQADRELSSGTQKHNIRIRADIIDLNQTARRGRQIFISSKGGSGKLSLLRFGVEVKVGEEAALQGTSKINPPGMNKVNG